jgi:hypothetical protein
MPCKDRKTLTLFNTITAVIETKGCWNRELRTAMKTQLVDDYLVRLCRARWNLFDRVVLSKRSELSPRRISKSRTSAGFPDPGENFPVRPI